MKTLFRKKTLACDLLVAGGGLSGVACALAASRNGAKVILIQDRSVLGGNASSEVRMHVVGANSGRPAADLEMEARESGIIEEIRLENACRNAQRSPSMFDFILYEKCRAEPNLTLLLNTSLIGAEVEAGRIQRVRALRPSTEEEFDISASLFADCTGDGGLGLCAGAAFQHGREERAQYGESLARENEDAKTLGSTLLLMARKHDRPVPFIAPPWARRFTEGDLRLRPHATQEIDSGLEYGFWWIEWGGQHHTIHDNELIRDELLAIVMGVWDHIKNDGDHGADYWALDWFGTVPGKRESRRFIGRHVLTQHDLMETRTHADTIAYGGWPVDLHPPEGVDRPDEPPCTTTPVPYLYEIPLRSCLARDIDNLLFAGRNLSASHIAFASTRVMATCSVIGEGVGTAAAYAIAKGCSAHALLDDPNALRTIQQQLLRQDCYLPGVSYKGHADLSRHARIRASSERENGAACNLLSGQTRAVSSNRGQPPERVEPGTHRWISHELPAWVELAWDKPVTLARLGLVFDTGLFRHLTLTQSDAYSRTMKWGSGQPECVRHYRLHLLRHGQWEVVAEVDNNWQRCRWHEWEQPLDGIEAVRVKALSAWGIDHARICRIFCFSNKQIWADVESSEPSESSRSLE